MSSRNNGDAQQSAGYSTPTYSASSYNNGAQGSSYGSTPSYAAPTIDASSSVYDEDIPF